jgi:hypothetical protein
MQDNNKIERDIDIKEKHEDDVDDGTKPEMVNENDKKKVDEKGDDAKQYVDCIDTEFLNMFYESKIEFKSLDTVTEQVCKFEALHGNKIKVTHSDPAKLYREYMCNAHTSCPFFCRFGPNKNGSNVICAKHCNLKHKGIVMLKMSKNGKRKRKE